MKVTKTQGKTSLFDEFPKIHSTWSLWMNPQWRSVALEILGYIDLVEFFMYTKLKSQISSFEPSKCYHSLWNGQKGDHFWFSEKLPQDPSKSHEWKPVEQKYLVSIYLLQVPVDWLIEHHKLCEEPRSGFRGERPIIAQLDLNLGLESG